MEPLVPNSRPRHSPVSLLVVLAALAGAVAPPVVAEVSGSARIFDGDTIEIGTLRIRIHGIDAPERDQDCAAGDGGTWRCGTEAASRLTQLLRLGDPVCEGRERDQYGRLIATCRVGETDLGAMLRSFTVTRRPGRFTVTTASDPVALGDGVEAVVRESEGLTVIATVEAAERHGWAVSFEAACSNR